MPADIPNQPAMAVSGTNISVRPVQNRIHMDPPVHTAVEVEPLACSVEFPSFAASRPGQSSLRQVLEAALVLSCSSGEDIEARAAGLALSSSSWVGLKGHPALD